ncbi:MAG: hypothetical protein WHX52_07090 [Anaerolineae bacterium]
MPYQMQLIEPGIVRISFSGGSLGADELDDFIRDFHGYLDATTPEAPINILTIVEAPGAKLASKTRKAFTNLNADKRVGKAATLGVDRYARVLIGFMLKATGRDNIRFFDTEEQALAWLRE